MYRINFLEFEVSGDHENVCLFVNCRGDATVFINNNKSDQKCNNLTVHHRDLVTIVFEENFSADQFQGKNIFKWVKGALPVLRTTHVRYGFADCSHLQFVSKKIFVNNRQLKDFGHCFKNCTNLKVLREDLFYLNNLAEDFSHTFERCYSLISIPSKLFAYCPNASNFDKTFAHCRKLTLVPLDLFRYNYKIETAKDTFLGYVGFGGLPSIEHGRSTY